MRCAGSICVVLLALVALAFPQQTNRLPPLPPPADIDPQLTEKLRGLEQQLGEAAMHMDTKVVERLVGPEYALRMGDAPEQSVPRALWMESLRPEGAHPYKLESFDEHYQAARKLTKIWQS